MLKKVANFLLASLFEDVMRDEKEATFNAAALPAERRVAGFRLHSNRRVGGQKMYPPGLGG